jgi:hypothetical protein
MNLKLNGKAVTDYSYLTNPNGMYTQPWVENNTVTFYTPTKTGGKLLYDWLDRIAYFADEIVIGNDSNSLLDDDLEFIKLYTNVKVVATNMDDNFGVGRNLCLDHCTSHYIMQLDIDEQVNDLSALRRTIDITQYDAWMFGIDNLQKDGRSITTETLRLFKNNDGVRYWGRLHETIDAHIQKAGWKMSKSPVKLTHYGYTIQTNDQAFKKMQRYLDINLKQMKETPDHGMAYYSTALHFLEDNLVDDALKLLDIAAFLMPQFPLATLELGKTHLRKANSYIARSMGNVPDSNPIKQGFRNVLAQVQELSPNNTTIAKGHCLGYFNSRPDDAKWLHKHVEKMNEKIETERTRRMEQAAKR